MDTSLELRVSQRGFGVIEIVISMFLLGLLAIAFLPLLVNSMKSTVTNSSIATATQLVNQQMDRARGAGDTCALMTEFGNALPGLVGPDSRGVSYQLAPPDVSCPSSYPGTARVLVSVSVVGSTIAPITATTLIFLKAA